METLRGVVERITYRSEETGYTVARLHQEGKSGDDLVTLVGPMASVSAGEHLVVEGEWSTHARHGRQFRVSASRTVYPSTVEGIRKYLGSGLIKGVGPVTAGRIVDHFGADALEVIENAPERLTEVGGLGPKRVEMIRQAWETQDRKSTRLNSSHSRASRMPSSA